MGEPTDCRRIIEKHLQQYERGKTTANDLYNGIHECVLLPGFFDHWEMLPDFILDDLKRSAKEAVANPEDLFSIFGGIRSNDPNAVKEWEKRKRKERINGYWEKRVLREHFFPGDPLPEFEIMKFIGVVLETAETDGHVVIFGEDIDSPLIRNHPLVAVRPDNKWITTTRFAGDHRIDRESLKLQVKNADLRGIVLGPNISSVDDIPIGSKIYIDREAYKDIPRPEYDDKAHDPFMS